ncbi:hypothetical protein [Vulcanimicrobium alpinum]|uniref:hypothetical protein n=1 Tax=Vulcanimicrobium alpinum TaxID=3016050 RepID=UPI00295ED10B|nr:hypothetical protein [Vulcanimicrobium alpinum]
MFGRVGRLTGAAKLGDALFLQAHGTLGECAFVVVTTLIGPADEYGQPVLGLPDQERAMLVAVSHEGASALERRSAVGAVLGDPSAIRRLGCQVELSCGRQKPQHQRDHAGPRRDAGRDCQVHATCIGRCGSNHEPPPSGGEVAGSRALFREVGLHRGRARVALSQAARASKLQLVTDAPLVGVEGE